MDKNEYNNIEKLNTIIRAESMLSSNIRNTIIIFSLGISISSLLKIKYRHTISLVLYLTGLGNGLISLYNYYYITSNMYEDKYNLPNKTYIFNIIIIITMITILTIYFISKFMKNIK